MKSVIFVGSGGHVLIASYLRLHKDVCFNIPEADKKVIVFENLEWYDSDTKVKWIHVARNPFDEFALEMKQSNLGFPLMLKRYEEINIKMKKLYQEEEVLSLSYEVAIRNFRRILTQLSNYLGIENDKKWEQAVAQFIMQNNIKHLQLPRHLIAWNSYMKQKVEEIARKYPWSKDYTIKS
jgi:hypothetical protein